MRTYLALTCLSYLLCGGIGETATSDTSRDPVENIRQHLWNRYEKMQRGTSLLKNITQEQNAKTKFADDAKSSIESPQTYSDHGPPTGTHLDRSDLPDRRVKTVTEQRLNAPGQDDDNADVTTVRTPITTASSDDNAEAPRAPTAIHVVCAVLIWLGIGAAAVCALACCVYCPAGCSPAEAGRTLVSGASTVEQAKHLQHISEHDDSVRASNCYCGLLQLAAHKCVEAFLNCILHGPDACQKSCPEPWCTLCEEEGRPGMVYNPDGSELLTRGLTSPGPSEVKPVDHEAQVRNTPTPNKVRVRPLLGHLLTVSPKLGPQAVSPLSPPMAPQAVFFPPQENSPSKQRGFRDVMSAAQKPSSLPEQIMQGKQKATSRRPGDSAEAVETQNIVIVADGKSLPGPFKVSPVASFADHSEDIELAMAEWQITDALTTAEWSVVKTELGRQKMDTEKRILSGEHVLAKHATWQDVAKEIEDQRKSSK